MSFFLFKFKPIKIFKEMKNKRNASATRLQLATTDKMYKLRIISKNDNDLSDILGISKVTMYTRMDKSNWKLPEIALVSILTRLTDQSKDWETLNKLLFKEIAK